MDTPRQDPEQLLVLQRAAGILNLSVDELLQLQRGRSDSTLSLGGRSNRAHHGRNDTHEDRQQYASFPANGSDDILWEHSQNPDISPFQQDANQFEMADFPSLNSERPTLESPSPSHGISHAAQHTSHENVVLLNPEIQNAWYACNLDYDMIEFGEISGSDRNDSSGTDGFIQLTPVSHDSDAGSESTTRDDDVDMESADEDDHLLSIATPADRRSSSSLGSRQYKLIAPRPGTDQARSHGSSPGASNHRVRKRRAPYSAAHRFDTNLTRSLNACVRCRIQRNRVCAAFPAQFCLALILSCA